METKAEMELIACEYINEELTWTLFAQNVSKMIFFVLNIVYFNMCEIGNHHSTFNNIFTELDAFWILNFEYSTLWLYDLHHISIDVTRKLFDY